MSTYTTIYIKISVFFSVFLHIQNLCRDKYKIVLKGMVVIERFVILEFESYHYAVIGSVAFYLAAIESNITIGNVVLAAYTAIWDKVDEEKTSHGIICIL